MGPPDTAEALTATNRALVRSFYGLLDQPEAALLRGAPGFIQHHTDMETPWVGRERFREHLAMFSTRFVDLRFELEDGVADGDLVAVRYTLRETSREGKTLELPGMDFVRLKAGLLEEVWGIFDQALFMPQLGA